MEDARKMAGLNGAVRSFVAEAWDAASKEAKQLSCKAAAVAAADNAKYKVRPLAPREACLSHAGSPRAAGRPFVHSGLAHPC